MTLHPEIQTRAQQDIQNDIGSDRLPIVEDFERGEMKYITALIREILRWGVVAPIGRHFISRLLILCSLEDLQNFSGIPHRATQEDTYMGYRIPKHATFIPNIWYVRIKQLPTLAFTDHCFFLLYLSILGASCMMRNIFRNQKSSDQNAT